MLMTGWFTDTDETAPYILTKIRKAAVHRILPKTN